MASAFKCDRCGAFYTTEEDCNLVVRVQRLKPVYNDVKHWCDLDLCPICQDDFEKFVDMKES